MKKSKKFILAAVVILVAGIALILAKPSLVDDSTDEIIPTVIDEEVIETSEELQDEIFD